MTNLETIMAENKSLKRRLNVEERKSARLLEAGDGREMFKVAWGLCDSAESLRQLVKAYPEHAIAMIYAAKVAS